MHAAVSARVESSEPGRHRRRDARRLAGPGLFLLVLALLFTAYLRLSRTYPENSDEANILLMASDMLHGNVLLSGWSVSDVPFISTELPETALLVRLFGLHLNTAHIAAAFTYTVVVGAAMLLAASGPRAVSSRVIRMAIVVAIMLAPQPGVGVFVLVFSVGHIGTAAPVLLSWLVLERFRRCYPSGGQPPQTPPTYGQRYPSGGQPPQTPPTYSGRRAWLGPAAVAAGLGWALLADPLVLVIAVVPLVLVGLLRLLPLPHALSRSGPEVSLVLAAGASYLLARGGRTVLRLLGGYTQQPVPFALAPAATWPGHARVMLHGLLELFGAYPRGPGLAEAVAVTRLACVALALAGVAAMARRFFRRDADLVSQLLLVGLVANLAAYLPSTLADHTALNAREFAPVLPFAAVLAARLTADRIAAIGRIQVIARRRVLAAAVGALFAWYCAGLAYQAAAPAAPNPFARLEAFLEAHHLTRGIGGYWNASVITVDTGGSVTIRAVTQGCLQPYAWESKPAWYVPGNQSARFILASRPPGYFSAWRPSPAAQRRLDALLPAGERATLNPGPGYLVRAYQANLLAKLPLLARC